MTRGKKSTIEQHPDKEQIDALLAAGAPLKDISAAIPDLSVHALSRYKRKHFSAPPTATDGDGDEASLESQFALWAQRADDLWTASAASLDLRGQAAAIATGIRSLQFALKNRERLAETQARDLPSDCADWTADEEKHMVSYVDSVIRSASETPYASVQARLMGLEIGLENNSELLPLFQRIARDPALLASVKSLMSEVQ